MAFVESNIDTPGRPPDPMFDDNSHLVQREHRRRHPQRGSRALTLEPGMPSMRSGLVGEGRQNAERAAALQLLLVGQALPMAAHGYEGQEPAVSPELVRVPPHGQARPGIMAENGKGQPLIADARRLIPQLVILTRTPPYLQIGFLSLSMNDRASV